MNSSNEVGRFWTLKRISLSLIIFVMLASLGFSSCAGPTTVTNSGNDNSAKTNNGQPSTSPPNNPNSPPPVTIPLPAAVMNTELTTIEGVKFKLSDFQGKVLLVNLWATWCGPCRSEIPDLIKVSEEYKAKGLEVIGLTSEDPEIDAVKVRDFVREFGITYKIGWSDQSFALALMQGNVRNTIPQSFLISRDGRVVKRFIGFNRTETPIKLRTALDEALSQK